MTMLDLGKQSHTIRKARRRLKDDLASRRQPVGLILMNPPDYAQRMRLEQVLRATPRIGRPRMNRLCELVGISPSRFLCELSLNDRRRLILAIPNDVIRASIPKAARSAPSPALATTNGSTGREAG